MALKTTTVASIAVAVLLTTTANAPAATGLHWTSKAVPGLEHLYRVIGGNDRAVCREESARVIRCLHVGKTVTVTLLTRTTARFVNVDRYGARHVQVNRLHNLTWAAG